MGSVCSRRQAPLRQEPRRLPPEAALCSRLGRLSPGDHVAVVTLRGSLCPVHKGHVQALQEARRLLLQEAPGPTELEDFKEVLAFVSLNSDAHVARKVRALDKEVAVKKANRAYLVELATAGLGWAGAEDTEGCSMEALQARWPDLRFVRFRLNGADDVIDTEKYKQSGPNKRFITIGRAGYTEQLRRRMAEAGGDVGATHFIIGPDLPDISSTDARAALAARDRAAAARVLHSRVAAWCLERGCFAEPAPSSKAALRERVGPSLDALPAGSRVAVVSLLGSLCPVTLGHVQGFLEARRILLGMSPEHSPGRLEPFREVLGFIACNTDSHVGGKMAMQGEESLDMAQRRHLVKLAVEEHGDWLFDEARGDWVCDWRQGRATGSLKELRHSWPNLEFVHFFLNGADDVRKYKKWRNPGRYITMGRAGETEALKSDLARDRVDLEGGEFILGPELPDISSSKARRALRAGDDDALAKLLHPAVTEWCRRHGAFGSTVRGGA